MKDTEIPVYGYVNISLLDKTELQDLVRMVAFALAHPGAREQLEAVCKHGFTYSGDLISKDTAELLREEGYLVVARKQRDCFHVCSQAGGVLIDVYKWLAGEHIKKLGEL